MTPLTPEQRAEILALHPGVSPDDLDAFETLLVERFEVAALDPSKVSELDDELAEMQQRLFPRFEEALRRVAERGPREPEEPDEEIGIV